MDDILTVFDSWSDIIEKARKPIGLDNWKKLSSVSDKLAGKQVSHITYTCAHPSHDGAPIKHTLGSTVGNTHFLLGYGNPGFYLADYHWQVIDPYIDEASSKNKRHPSNPAVWQASGLSVPAEGDMDQGDPHPSYSHAQRAAAAKSEQTNEKIEVKEGYSSYSCFPSQGLVYCNTNDHVYDWSLVKNSFFAAMNPDLTEKMNEYDIEQEVMQVPEPADIVPDAVKSLLVDDVFSQDVYPVISKSFPKPGSVVSLVAENGATVYGVVTSRSVDFYDKSGDRVGLSVYDRVYSSFDLTKSGDIHPSVLLSFSINHFGVNKAALSDLLSMGDTTSGATPGYDGVASDFVSVGPRNVVKVGDSYRVVPR